MTESYQPMEGTVVEGAAYDASFNTAAQKHETAAGVRLYLKITAKTCTSPTLDIKVQGKDPASGDWIDVAGAAFTQKNDVGSDILTLHPSMTAAANDIVKEPAPTTWRLVCAIGGSDTPTFTFSVGYGYLN